MLAVSATRNRPRSVSPQSVPEARLDGRKVGATHRSNALALGGLHPILRTRARTLLEPTLSSCRRRSPRCRARVPRAHQVSMLTEPLMNLTEPSHNTTLAPPGWLLMH